MTQQDNIVGAASVPTQQTDLHRAVAELQQAIGELQHAAHAPGTTGPAPTGVLPAAAVGGVVPVLLLGTAVFQFISAVWAFLLGQSLVAAIFGLFSGIASSLSILLLGVFHNWFAIPAADLSGVEALFTISWAIVFVFLTWIMLKLPAVYGAIMIFVEAALCLLSAAAVLAFTVLGAYAWLNVASEASGGPAWPPLGPPVRK
jgi:hypothetical protein